MCSFVHANVTLGLTVVLPAKGSTRLQSCVLHAKAATWLHRACLVGVSVGKLGRIGFPNDVVGAVRILVDGTPQNGAQDDENGAAMAAEERIASEVLAALSSRYPDFLMFGRNGGIPREATA